MTFDKAPGTFWLQALSARVFGHVPWAVLLPSLLASLASIVLMYRVVRGWAGPEAGVAATGFFAATPMVAALARTQIPDPVLVALLLAATLLWQRAVATDRLRPLLWTGVLVGLAVLWLAWLAVHLLAFAGSVKAHSFYNIALAPALSALAAAGLVALWRAYRTSGWHRWLLPAAVAASGWWAWHLARANRGGERYDLAVQWAPQAGQFITRGLDPLPIGGFTAQIPSVGVRRLDELVAAGELRYALVDGPQLKGKPTRDHPDYAAWAPTACRPVDGFSTGLYTLYDCAR
ncbi:glycosyltransferase family 39 protein [Dactylosporangium sp. NPDC050588]|uniref:ArnT family glycosyltransferase n=1 Tax=Dactylosporangium sp. NPDC050588 TaxID=3157211 RepID=UPI0033DAEC7F